MNKFLSGLFVLASLGSLEAQTTVAAGGKITPAAARELLATDNAAVLLDVRTAEEFAAGRIADSILLPYDEITAETAAKAIPSKGTAVVVYCRSGRRSAIAVERLRELGYRKAYDLGGIAQWPYGTVK